MRKVGRDSHDVQAKFRISALHLMQSSTIPSHILRCGKNGQKVSAASHFCSEPDKVMALFVSDASDQGKSII
jgi:hypothetical protein